jgi:hypothetical protein
MHTIYIFVICLLVGCSTIAKNVVDEYDNTLDNLAFRVQNVLVYKADALPEDEWQGADRAIQQGYGDCEEFAQVTQKYAKEIGLNSWIVIYQNGTHAGCIVEYGKRYVLFSNGSIMPEEYRSLSEALNKLKGVIW